MKEHRADQIDRSNMMLVNLPVSGEQYWVVKPDNYIDPVEAARAQMTPLNAAVAGQNQCLHCGQGFNSPNVLRDHITKSHPIASGQADMALVEMPDGTMVPADAVPEIVRQKEEAIVAKAEVREAELVAKVEELAAKLAKRTATKK